MDSLPIPKRIRIKNYSGKSRMTKDGYTNVYRCNYCTYYLHDSMKVKRHQVICKKRIDDASKAIDSY
jgi:hypothetical protein